MRAGIQVNIFAHVATILNITVVQNKILWGVTGENLPSPEIFQTTVSFCLRIIIIRNKGYKNQTGLKF